ncbi:MAG: sensor domain-containing diguanylate cyclase [candidate division WOR-3 bacterium]
MDKEKFTRILRALVKVSQDINTLKPLELLLDQIVRLCDRILSTSYSSIILVDEETMQWTKGATTDPMHRENIHKYVRERGATYTIVKTRKPLVVNDVSTSEFGGHPFLKESGVVSFMGAPIIHSDRVLGVLYTFSKKQRTFTGVELELLKFLAEQAAVAINNVKLYERIKEKSIKDELTGLYNYTYLRTVLDREIEKIKKGTEKVSSLLYVDLDDFGHINNTYGVKIGDEVLKYVSFVIASNIRKIDVAARYGGDEFLVYLDGISEYEGKLYAEKILNKIRLEPIILGKAKFTVTASIGVTSVNKSKDIDTVMKEADFALLEAKRKGKNCVELASDLFKETE